VGVARGGVLIPRIVSFCLIAILCLLVVPAAGILLPRQEMMSPRQMEMLDDGSPFGEGLLWGKDEGEDEKEPSAVSLLAMLPSPANTPTPIFSYLSGSTMREDEDTEAPSLFGGLDNLENGCRSRREIALTFDGGWEANATPFILDVLRRNGIKATFFLTGIYIKRYPEMVIRMVEEGHEVGNHTWTHPRLTTMAIDGKQTTLPDVNRAVVEEELKKCEDLFTKTTGREMARLWRAPYGEHNAEIRAWAKDAGFVHVYWTKAEPGEEGHGLDSLDWVADSRSPIYRNSEDAVRFLLDSAKNGGILLMHLGTLRKEDLFHLRLPQLIEGLDVQGFGFVTVGAMATEVMLASESIEEDVPLG